MPKIEMDEKCKSCEGTGLYKGMAERDGVAVQCYHCKGTGCHHFVYEWDEFVGRVEVSDVLRVLQTNPGICAGINEEKGYGVDAFGGMCYRDWKQGKPFPPKSEMREFTCPCWWYQSANYKKKPHWDECDAALGRTFSCCPSFATKEKCWERWDKEFGEDGK